MLGQVIMRAAVAAFLLGVVMASAILAIAPASAAECHDAVQGKLAWNARGDTAWSPQNVDKLCEGAGQSAEPAGCFKAVMSGQVLWDGGTSWTWDKAIALCRGSHQAQANISCFQDARSKGLSGPQAIEKCQGVGAAASVPAQEPQATLALNKIGNKRTLVAAGTGPGSAGAATAMRARMAASRDLDNMLRIVPGADMSSEEAQYISDMREKALALRTVFARENDLYGRLAQARQQLSEIPVTEAAAVRRARLERKIEALEEQLTTAGKDAQLAQTDLQDAVQKNQEALETMSNMSKAMHNAAMSVIRKLQ